MAPEMLRVDTPFDSSVDSWSLGIILFELLSNQMPFKANSMQELAQQVCDFELDFVEDPSWESISIEAKDLTENLLSKDPLNRIPVLEIKMHSWLHEENYLDKNVSLLAI